MPKANTSEDKAEAPSQFCNIVMKGGVTSGIVFPLGLVTLSRSFRFKNIGGTSAGAIAAALAAAAEHRRHRTGDPGGFAVLEALPTELGKVDPRTKHSRLFGLFQPQRATRPLFLVATAALGGGRWALIRILGAALRQTWVCVLIGLLPAASLVLAAYHLPPFWRALSLIGAGILLPVIPLGLVIWKFARTLSKVTDNSLGLCSGMPGEQGDETGALTVWLADRIDQAAGLAAEGEPLTFGQLWGSADQSDGGGEREVNLEMMTTCLTLGRPYRLPFRDDEDVKENRRFYFNEKEFRQLFPKRVVDWMVKRSLALDAKLEDPDDLARRLGQRKDGFHPLPAPADFPVIVATRMSLSFPVLLSAIPLHSVDYSRPEVDKTQPTRCWFSDGGICSNFPLHFFDTPLPRRPTFAISLAPKDPLRDAGVYLPKTNGGGLGDRWNLFDRSGGIGALTGLLTAILDTAKDWQDTLLARAPGHRDRIATVSLDANDGGLNLDMPSERISRLARFGAEAGEALATRFSSGVVTGQGESGWTSHRRVRLRASLAAVEELILRIEADLNAVQSDEMTIEAMIDAKKPATFANITQREAAKLLLTDLRAIAHRLRTSAADSATNSLRHGAPRPPPEFRLRPRT